MGRYTSGVLGIVDTAVRTVKKLINKYMDMTDNPKFESAIDEIVDIYNTTPHSSLKGHTPDYAYKDIKLQAKLYKEGQTHNAQLTKSIDLDIGDYVRKSLDKSKFEKEKQSYSKTVYVIHDIVGKKYVLMDENGNIDERHYKYSQLLKIDPNKTKVFSLYKTLEKKYRGNQNKKRRVEEVEEQNESKVEEARRLYKKAKRTMRQLKKEGIDADTVVMKEVSRKRKGDDTPEETVADRIVKRRILRSKRVAS